MAQFRIGVSASLLGKGEGAPFPTYDVTWMHDDPDIEVVALPAESPLPSQALAELDAAILLGERISAESLAGSKRLSLFCRMGVGYDTLDIPACSAADVAVTITPPGVRRPMAVAILTLLLALATNLLHKDRITRGGKPGWRELLNYHGTGLVGRTFAQIGIGNIGAEAMRLVAPLGFRRIAHDPYIDPKVAEELGVELVSLEDAFRQADFMSVSCPLNDETRHLVNAERLALMKPSAFLINTSRGPVVDQRALYEVLKDRRIAGAGLDVFDPEPPEADDPILKLDNVVLTPHALGFSDQMFATMSEVNRAAINAVRAGQNPEHTVNGDVLARDGFKSKLVAFREG